MSRELTTDEVRAEFLKHVQAIIRNWETVKLAENSVRARLEGLAFSLLVLLDGGSVGLPAFIVAPCPHPADREFHQEEGTNWWPENDWEAAKANISGGLHEDF